MLEYFAIYRNEYGWEQGEAPVGIIVDQQVAAPDWSRSEYHALHWNHVKRAWVYDPEGCALYLSDEDNLERQRPIERDEAERITPPITGGEELPDEDTILWIFQWKGEPPQAEDSKHRWAWDR